MSMQERTRQLRRPRRMQTTSTTTTYRSKGTMGLVPPGTRGIYDSNPNIRSATARAMVARRQMVEVTCEVPHCVRGEGGTPKRFLSRLINGRPERRGCCSAHRLWLWRQEMKARGYKQVTVDGEVGWLTPDKVFFPNPSQPKPRRDTTRGGRARNTQREQKTSMEVTPGSG